MAITIYLSLIFLALYFAGLGDSSLDFCARPQAHGGRKAASGGRVVARVDEVQPGAVKKFWLICQKYRLDAILINDRGNYSRLCEPLPPYADAAGFRPRRIFQRRRPLFAMLHSWRAL